ncbi:hypothetical protein [Alloalcanivorax mobilis]|uniref:hypothetical protein n=1 Tax=Alloalcanivorax mobilis TaxID=2019569 RepID=UPI000C778072|nr:hypothetical protein [Alloalcanivorax mobilis]
MGFQKPFRVSDSPRCLAIEAVTGRAGALNEYLVVYRAGAGRRGRRVRSVRELRYDIERLRAWAWYLAASSRRPWWWRLVTHLGGLFGRRRREANGRRRDPRRSMQRLSSFSVIDRAYAALQEDFQGRLLTLALPQTEPERSAACRAHLTDKVDTLRGLRGALVADAGRAAVVCVLLAGVLRLRGWLGLDVGLAPGEQS